MNAQNSQKLWCDTNLIILICFVIHLMLAGFFFYYGMRMPVVYSVISAAIHLAHFLLHKKIDELISYTFVLYQINFYVLFFSLYFRESAGAEIIPLMMIPTTFFLTYNKEHPPLYYILTLIPTFVVAIFVTCAFNYTPGELPYPNKFYRIHHIFCVMLGLLLVYLCFVTEKRLIQANHRNEMKRKALIYTANHDPLTKLINRRRMWEWLRQAETDKKEQNQVYVLSIFDIDDFKQINDHYGHDAGDAVLQRTTSLIRSKLPSNIKLARWGGEEFMLLFFNGSAKSVDFIEGIRKLIENNTIDYKGLAIRITLTFGVSSALISDDIEAVIIDADKALISGKKGTKNCVVVSPEMQKTLQLA